MKNLYAYTETNVRSYPAFISVNADSLTKASFTVRSAGGDGLAQGHIELTAEQVKELVAKLNAWMAMS